MTATVAILAGTLVVMDRAGGRQLLEKALSEQSPAMRNWMESQAVQGTDVSAAETAFQAVLACLVGLWAVALVTYVLWVRRARWVIWIGGFLATYVALEQWMAPFLFIPFLMNEQYYVADPDHWPVSTDAERGWNSDSLRCSSNADSFRPEDLNLLFLGDSFTFGSGLPPEQSFPSKVETALGREFPQRGIRVANFGWISSSPLLSHRRLEALGPRYYPDLVVQCIDMTDFSDDLRWKAMLERRGFYWWDRHFPMLTKILESLAPRWVRDQRLAAQGDPPKKRLFPTEYALKKTRPFLEPLVTNLDAIHTWCEAQGCEFLVIALPRSYQYSDREAPMDQYGRRVTPLGPHSLAPFRFFEEVSERVPYPIHSILEAFQTTRLFPTCFVNDPHWNDNGTSVAAAAITRVLAPWIRSRAPGSANR